MADLYLDSPQLLILLARSPVNLPSILMNSGLVLSTVGTNFGPASAEGNAAFAPTLILGSLDGAWTGPFGLRLGSEPLPVEAVAP